MARSHLSNSLSLGIQRRKHFVLGLSKTKELMDMNNSAVIAEVGEAVERA